MVTVKLTVYGRVQGVFFRQNTKNMAERLNLHGYAKNLPDGTVEILVQGELENIKKLSRWCKQGPEMANVESIESETLSSYNKKLEWFDVF